MALDFRNTNYDGDLDIQGNARGSYGIALAERRMATLGYNFDKLGYNASAPDVVLDELSDPEVCKHFVERVEREGLSIRFTLDLQRKVDSVKSWLPKFYSKNGENFAYHTLGLAKVGRTFYGILARARRTIKKSNSSKST